MRTAAVCSPRHLFGHFLRPHSGDKPPANWKPTSSRFLCGAVTFRRGAFFGGKIRSARGEPDFTAELVMHEPPAEELLLRGLISGRGLRSMWDEGKEARVVKRVSSALAGITSGKTDVLHSTRSPRGCTYLYIALCGEGSLSLSLSLSLSRRKGPIYNSECEVRYRVKITTLYDPREIFHLIYSTRAKLQRRARIVRKLWNSALYAPAVVARAPLSTARWHTSRFPIVSERLQKSRRVWSPINNIYLRINSHFRNYTRSTSFIRRFVYTCLCTVFVISRVSDRLVQLHARF